MTILAIVKEVIAKKSAKINFDCLCHAVWKKKSTNKILPCSILHASLSMHVIIRFLYIIFLMLSSVSFRQTEMFQEREQETSQINTWIDQILSFNHRMNSVWGYRRFKYSQNWSLLMTGAVQYIYDIESDSIFDSIDIPWFCDALSLNPSICIKESIPFLIWNSPWVTARTWMQLSGDIALLPWHRHRLHATGKGSQRKSQKLI